MAIGVWSNTFVQCSLFEDHRSAWLSSLWLSFSSRPQDQPVCFWPAFGKTVHQNVLQFVPVCMSYFFMVLFQTCAKNKVLGFSPHFSTGTSSTFATHFRCCVFLPKGDDSMWAARRGRKSGLSAPLPRLARTTTWLQSFEPTLGWGSTCINMSGFSRCQIVILNVLWNPSSKDIELVHCMYHITSKIKWIIFVL